MPSVSVVMVTYNHERYIAQAIESVLSQQLDYPLELIVADDCSTDGTRQIVRDYATRFPDRIRPLLQPRNIGAARNFVSALTACTGKYIALLDGDDYWTCEHKLQGQVDFLERHSDFVLSAHQVHVLYEDGSQPSRLEPEESWDEVDVTQMLETNLAKTCSVVLRAGLADPYPDWFLDIASDWPLFLLVAEHGKIRVSNEPMAVYRIHKGGVWTGSNRISRFLWVLGFMPHIDKHFGYKYHERIRRVVADAHAVLAAEYDRLGDWPSFLMHRIAGWCHQGKGRRRSSLWPLFERILSSTPGRLLLRLCAPPVVKFYKQTRRLIAPYQAA